MNRNTVKIGRRELYEQVWTEPMTKLSKRYGLSDVGLAKICRKNNIPRPTRGYWAKSQSGKKVNKIPLPQRGNDWNIYITESPFNTFRSENRDILCEVTSSTKQLLKKVVVPEILIDPHPLIDKSSEVLASCKPDRAGLLVPPQEQCLEIQVSKDSLPRALRIMDALIKALTVMGFEVSVSGKSTDVKIFDVSLSIGIGEALARRRIKAEDHNLDGYYEFGYKLFKKQPVPSGKLFLKMYISDVSLGRGHRKKWRDTESKKLEDYLQSFVSGLIKAAALEKSHKHVWEKE